LDFRSSELRGLIEREGCPLAVARQCALLGLARSTCYYEPASESPLNLELMGRIDREYTRLPFYGSPRMTQQLRRLGYAVNEKRVERLMREMGLRAVVPRRGLSGACAYHKKWPYLLRGLKIERPNQVWSSDITYIGVRGGFFYLTAVMDWFSRYVLAWELSNSLDSTFCVEALERALSQSQPEIFNTDQGVQYTSDAFTGRLAKRGVRISMDGRGRCFDNIFTERLWKSVKYEEVYLKEYEDGRDARRSLDAYFSFYNLERFHQSLDWRVPYEVHHAAREKEKSKRAKSRSGEESDCVRLGARVE
jgi:putative transposase